jgi:hypothetical protein
MTTTNQEHATTSARKRTADHKSTQTQSAKRLRRLSKASLTIVQENVIATALRNDFSSMLPNAKKAKITKTLK